MTTPQAQKVVLYSSVTLFGCVTIARVVGMSMGINFKDFLGEDTQLPPARAWIGMLVAGSALSTLAEFAPDLAAGLAMSMGGTAFVNYGVPVMAKYFDESNIKLDNKPAKVSTTKAQRA